MENRNGVALYVPGSRMMPFSDTGEVSKDINANLHKMAVAERREPEPFIHRTNEMRKTLALYFTWSRHARFLRSMTMCQSIAHLQKMEAEPTTQHRNDVGLAV